MTDLISISSPARRSSSSTTSSSPLITSTASAFRPRRFNREETLQGAGCKSSRPWGSSLTRSTFPRFPSLAAITLRALTCLRSCPQAPAFQRYLPRRLHRRPTSLSNYPRISGIASALENLCKRRRIRPKSSRCRESSKASMSTRSRGRFATAFITMRSSALATGRLTAPARTTVPRATASFSKGRSAMATSTSIRLGRWRSSKTLDLFAKPAASLALAESQWRFASRRASSKRLSSIAAKRSISRVRRGLARTEAATPPISTPRTPASSSQ